MYIALSIVLYGLALYFFFRGLYVKKRNMVVLGAGIAIFTILFFRFLVFYSELLWFENLGYDDRFWTLELTRVSFIAGGAIGSAFLMTLLTLYLSPYKQRIRYLSIALAAITGGFWGLSSWESFLLFTNQVSTSLQDPILGQTVGFYLFTLPIIKSLLTLLIWLSVLALIVSLAGAYLHPNRNGVLEFYQPMGDAPTMRRLFFPVYFTGGILLVVLAIQKYIDRFNLMYSDWGAVAGPGWTDVQIRLPAYWVVSVLTLMAGLSLLLTPGRRIWQNMARKLRGEAHTNHPIALIMAAISVALLWVTALSLVPGAFQFLRVEPNEITLEKPYILHNIDFTRRAFNLHNAEEREFTADGDFTASTVEDNPDLFENIRLWDYRALDEVFRQFQEIRLYYEFRDVDIDRYMIDGKYRQVMVSAREMNVNNLPDQSKTFVNQRFKYTHGFGITLTPVSNFTREGLPEMLIKDIPPKSVYPSLEVTEPRIYYGEVESNPVIVNSNEPEFDYPSGEENIYNRYEGEGGVPLTNWWRRFVYGYRFDGTRFLFSSYPTDSSRMMYHRQVRQRVKKLAPFLTYDKDPYIVLSGGRLYWIIDAYTTSRHYPYSEPYNERESISFGDSEQDRQNTQTTQPGFAGVNYLRNSVKAVVDAYDGSVQFYVFDEEDPLIRTWSNVFEGLFRPSSEMPDDLRSHVRYPLDMLLVQGLVYAKYHMSDPTVFYNQEDLWIRATEKYRESVQAVEPYYILWKQEGNPELQFSLILPFTPKNRRVLIGWVAGLCDGDNYGKFISYNFPKDTRVLGPQQVETKIDQDSHLSGQLSLWDQRGSNVIRGNVLAIPIGNTLIYVEPIYLQAETAAYPELRLVAVMHGDELSYAESFGEALEGLFNRRAEDGRGPSLPVSDRPTQPAGSESQVRLIEEANRAFEEYVRYTSQRRYEEAGQALQELEQHLKSLNGNSNEKSTENIVIGDTTAASGNNE
ncbi:UPF0182 family protein [Roseivirga sp. BDSF3-8]|uniref:UPF0182 family membrane protein n=1 Tax=Roseivirga sp. BDSF3-8 TaxID=3241598 RepID=UPI0035325DBF